MIDIFHFTL